MTEKVTLVLILHNRHKNLDRLLEYYNEYDFPIIIADSSSEEHQFTEMKPNWNYIFTPGIFFTQKLEIVLPEVCTPFVLLCADDDFILPKSIWKCVDFLEKNQDYTVAQGLSIHYTKESVPTGNIKYGPLYTAYNNVEDDDVIKRLFHFFNPYRSVLYAVFKAEALQQAFAGAGIVIKQLFLNEYITAFLPIQSGKYKELPILYQVREYAHDSDDKTAANLDTLIKGRQYKNDVDSFIDLIAEKTHRTLRISFIEAKKMIISITYDFAKRLDRERNYISPKKRIGNIVAMLPIVGKWLIKLNRDAERKQRLAGYFDISSEQEEINRISGLLKKYSIP